MHDNENIKRYKTRIIWNTGFVGNYCDVSKWRNYESECNYFKYDETFDNKYNSDSDHLKLRFRECGDKRCKTCPMMQNEQKNEESEFKFCKTFNCIYMLTCGVCGFRYIGQTSGAMNLRINQHRSDIGKNKTTKNIGRIEIQHFNKHGFEDVALNIIKIVPNKINRLWYENVYIGIYNAMYPYGLNVIWNNKNLIQAVKQNDKESIYNSRNNSNKRKRVGKGGRKKRENRDIDTVKKK
ncbi:GIY-YIG domain-containing protein [Trichonephila clavipes]|nr:GIY-YIG domain-containing protein [Trichonephila clavipes]